MADKVVLLRDGRIEQAGPPLELYDRPANLFVAGFIGSPGMNFIEGASDGTAFVTRDGLRLPLPPELAGHAEEGLVWGVRPEHLALDEAGLPLTVKVVEPTGAEIQIIGRLGGQPFVAALRERIAPEAGSTLHLAPDPARLHVFRGGSGERLN